VPIRLICSGGSNALEPTTKRGLSISAPLSRPGLDSVQPGNAARWAWAPTPGCRSWGSRRWRTLDARYPTAATATGWVTLPFSIAFTGTAAASSLIHDYSSQLAAQIERSYAPSLIRSAHKTDTEVPIFTVACHEFGHTPTREGYLCTSYATYATENIQFAARLSRAPATSPSRCAFGNSPASSRRCDERD